ncbi:RagB/SusD family nutrient uptake outer membrane protein [Zunongwangia sp. HGR-M22]|uniref:RagB/SusD family nutrient uptake outer membrane protein n=1 Tax=Zunongwangia sp. HGR-M22 TaxID=3015168 RepID=UPI0022DDF4B9|nr:RagB/SusD family nutrient uptake outer membrane protein [Zunongwangia sp. HGR-M22]WBL26123.1 RagB/SusD family nutrient uptake outer membrane protein [Zunongwangia sp. HGR-M22]
MKRQFLKIMMLCLVVSMASCGDDFLENKQFSTTPQEVTSVKDLNALLYGAFIDATDVTYYGRDMIIYGAVRGDIAYNDGGSGRFRGPSYYNMISTDAYATDTFTQMYKIIGELNTIINSDYTSVGQEDEIKNTKGQAYVFRALVFFDLVKLYGQEHTGGDLGIPILLDYDPVLKPARASLNETYKQIESDFEKGISMLDESGINNPGTKDLINKYSAKGLASRYFLYRGTSNAMQKAYNYTLDIIESGVYAVANADQYINTFSQDLSNANSLFELAIGNQARLGTTSIAYMYSDAGYGDIHPLENLESNFDENDVRLELFSGDHVELKYPSIRGDNSIKILRYEEILLTNAEAVLRLNNDSSKALELINQIATNRGISAYTDITIDDVLVERKKELFFEGQRFFDMLRTKQNIPVWSPDGTPEQVENEVENAENRILIYGNSYELAFPIPQRELDINSKMEQNPGYSS